MNFQEKLLAISNDLATLAASLDGKPEECACCGANRFGAFDEEMASRKLAGWSEAVENLARSTDKKTGGTPAFLSRTAPDAT